MAGHLDLVCALFFTCHGIKHNYIINKSSFYLFSLELHSFFFIEGSGTARGAVCIRCDELLTTEHILLTCLDLIEIRESHITVQSLHIYVVSGDFT